MQFHYLVNKGLCRIVFCRSIRLQLWQQIRIHWPYAPQSTVFIGPSFVYVLFFDRTATVISLRLKRRSKQRRSPLDTQLIRIWSQWKSGPFFPICSEMRWSGLEQSLMETHLLACCRRYVQYFDSIPDFERTRTNVAIHIKRWCNRKAAVIESKPRPTDDS